MGTDMEEGLGWGKGTGVGRWKKKGEGRTTRGGGEACVQSGKGYCSEAYIIGMDPSAILSSAMGAEHHHPILNIL